ncbi:MAG: hypothetical protein R3D89_07865 [Sphingomonadaceae bacterium]
MRGDIVDIYLEECEKARAKPSHVALRPGGGMPLGIHLCEDPEAGWAALEPHALHVVKEYAKWAAQEGDGSNSPFKGLDNAEACAPRACSFLHGRLKPLVQAVRANPEINNVGLQIAPWRTFAEEGWKSLRLLKQVLPELRGE